MGAWAKDAKVPTKAVAKKVEKTRLPANFMDWKPYGDTSTVEYLGDMWSDLTDEDVIDPSNVAYGYNAPYTALPEYENVLNVYGTLYDDTETNLGYGCPLKVNGNIVIDATLADMTMNIMPDDSGYENPVVIEPFLGYESTSYTEYTCAQVYFKTDVNRTITVNVNNNLEFKGKTLDDETGQYKDMIVTFAGRGQVVFNMADGTSIKFNGQTDPMGYVEPNACLIDGPSNYAAGTKVYILMDQTKDDFDANKNKVVFQRAPGSQRTLIEVGPNSVLTYLSTNPYGIPAYYDADAEYTYEYTDGYGAIAFDPSFAASVVDPNNTGRMVLFIKGAYDIGNLGTTEAPDYGITGLYPFNDASVMIAGHYVADFEPETISGCSSSETETTSEGPMFDTPAGIKAAMRVIDAQHYASQADYKPLVSDRRGLLVVNDVLTHGKLMSDPYWDLFQADRSDITSMNSYNWMPSNAYNASTVCRKGFILGVNGMVDVYHNNFIDYAAGGVNVVDNLEYCDGSVLSDLKLRNPSALIVDGIDPYLFAANPSGEPCWFTAADPFTEFGDVNGNNPHAVVQGTIQFRGNGALYLKSTASTAYGFMHDLFVQNGEVVNPSDDPTLDWNTILNVGTGSYDGYLLSANDNTVAMGEGEHVLDVEGPLDVVSRANVVNPELDWTYETTIAALKQGMINAACLALNYQGMNVCDYPADDYTISQYPLDLVTAYARYNSPGLFFNNNAAFYDSILRHSDATKYVDGLPNFSEPAMTGGERLWFGRSVWNQIYTQEENASSDPNRYRFPEIQLFNSTLEIQESLNVAGLRLVAKDITNRDFTVESDTNFSNKSYIKFFDHGRKLDTMLTGFGRILMFGSTNNLMAGAPEDSEYASWYNDVTESAFLNVFKTNTAELAYEQFIANPSTVDLQFVCGDQFPLNDIPASPADIKRAQHLVMFAQLPTPLDIDGYEVTNLPMCNATVGWTEQAEMEYSARIANEKPFTAPAGDAGRFPYCFPYSTEPLIAPSTEEVPTVFESHPFELDALYVPAATMSIGGTDASGNYLAGSYICFGSFDEAGNSLKIPVGGNDIENVSGVVYVKHGGKISTPVVESLTETTRNLSPVPAQGVFATMLCARIFNDYDVEGTMLATKLSGIVDLPADQIKFDTNYSVQPYNFTTKMFGARVWVDPTTLEEFPATDGYVRLPTIDAQQNGEPVARGLRRDISGWEEATIGWFWKEPAGMIPPKSVKGINPETRNIVAKTFSKFMTTRATESIKKPINRYNEVPELLYVGPGDDIYQLRVAGATKADRFALDVSGNHETQDVARVREIVSVKSTADQIADHFISEGAHAMLFVEFGGRIGLGSRSWNEHSSEAWNILGKDYVTICPLGQGTIDVNENLIVSDRQALIATESFGAARAERLTFYAQHPYEIRVTAGGELDLSSFGQSANRQEIAFGGKIKLVIEDGATIRFPEASEVDGGVVLYFNDESQLIFEGRRETAKYVPFIPSAPTSEARCKLVGKGQIWLNKYAQMRVDNGVFVGVETDDLNPETNLTISLQRQSAFYIGDENTSAGTFQVGNSVDRAGHSIDFKLILNGAKSLFHIDREGFFGLGAGIINKNGNPNGDADLTENPLLDADGNAQVDVNGYPLFTPDTDVRNGVWEVQRLYDVSSVEIEVAQGIVDHRNIVDGSSSNASVFAVGPCASYTLSVNGPRFAKFHGGGNIMNVPLTATADNPVYVNMWDYDGPMSTGERYSLLASGPLLLDRRLDLAFAASPAGPGILNYGDLGLTFKYPFQANFFDVLANRQLTAQPDAKVSYAATAFGTFAAYSNEGTNTKYTTVTAVGTPLAITRVDSPSTTGVGTVAESVEAGALGAVRNDAGDVVGYTVIQSR
jgi:hypothetical protein